MVMSPNILEVMSFWVSTRVTATVVCCILMQILCVVSQKKLQLPSPIPPTGAPPLDPARGLLQRVGYESSAEVKGNRCSHTYYHNLYES